MENELAIHSSTDRAASDMLKVFGVVMIASLMANVILNKISSSPLTQYVQAQSYRGVSDPRVIEATDELSYVDLVGEPPYSPWVSANLINDGPDSVRVAVNYSTALYELREGESSSIYRIGAQERIALVFFICNTGERASVRMIGEY